MLTHGARTVGAENLLSRLHWLSHMSSHVGVALGAQIMVASTASCLAASRFGLAPSVKKVAQPLKLADREVMMTTGDPAGECGCPIFQMSSTGPSIYTLSLLVSVAAQFFKCLAPNTHLCSLQLCKSFKAHEA